MTCMIKTGFHSDCDLCHVTCSLLLFVLNLSLKNVDFYLPCLHKFKHLKMRIYEFWIGCL